MDPQRFKATYQRLKALDERLTHKVRPRGGGSFARPGIEQIEEMVAIAAAPPAKGSGPAAS